MRKVQLVYELLYQERRRLLFSIACVSLVLTPVFGAPQIQHELGAKNSSACLAVGLASLQLSYTHNKHTKHSQDK